MTATRILTCAAVVAVAACGDRKTPQDATFDSAVGTAVTPLPRNPHIMAFDVGHGVTTTGTLVGGMALRFAPTDSVFLAIRTQYAPVGAPVAARLKLGTRTVDSAAAATGAPDSTGGANVVLRFGSARARDIGNYDVEVFLSGKSEGIKRFRIGP
ncbi:MAG TPA: hypothetical protein VHW65_09285 [Gemmatimonadales bacterium]|jgi:hypothetical protein|nr:hypothetical protein [Gemmatimonadales bacterium]